MNKPRLTIGIPTLNRPELLKRSIESALNQTTPAKIIVADQGHSSETAGVIAHFLKGEHAPLVHHLLTDATCVWENWQAAAKAADTEFFAWLQDDDVVSRGYANRVISAFDTFPEANCWIARLATATAPDRAIWFAPNGPLLPCDLLSGRPCLVEGKLFPPLCYFTSFAMSPAVAFRVGDAFWTAVDRCPKNCDLFTERMILAAIGLQGAPVIFDPVFAGLWIQHEDNESKRQRKNQDDQVKVLADWTDAAMNELPGDWQDYFESWASILTDSYLLGFLNELGSPHYAKSTHAQEVKQILVKALAASATLIPAPPDTLKAVAIDIFKTLLGLGRRALKIARRASVLR